MSSLAPCNMWDSDSPVRYSDIDIVPLVLQQMLRLWFGDLEDAMQSPAPVSAQQGQQGDDMEEAFGLYRRANKLVDMGNAFLRSVPLFHPNEQAENGALTRPFSEPVSHNLAPSFENTVKVWLDQTALKTRQWADQALSVDTVSPTKTHYPSALACV